MLPTVNVNYMAVLVASLLSFVLGWIWHSPMMFGNLWLKLNKVSQKEVEDAKKKGMGAMLPSIAYQLIATLITAYILAYFISYSGASTILEGITVGFWAWLGFVATSMIAAVIWEKKPFQLFLINAGHVLANLIIMGGILAVWV